MYVSNKAVKSHEHDHGSLERRNSVHVVQI